MPALDAAPKQSDRKHVNNIHALTVSLWPFPGLIHFVTASTIASPKASQSELLKINISIVCHIVY